MENTIEALAEAQRIEDPCLICKSTAEKQIIGPATFMFYCPRCGVFAAASATWLPVETDAHMVRLSGWVREQNAAGGHPMISMDTSRRVAQMKFPGLRERASKALEVIAQKFPEIDAWYSTVGVAADEELLGRSYSAYPDDAKVLMHLLLDAGLLAGDMSSGAFHISVAGLLEVEDRGKVGSGAQGFVAMWFDPRMDDAWTNGFDPRDSSSRLRSHAHRQQRIFGRDFGRGHCRD